MTKVLPGNLILLALLVGPFSLEHPGDRRTFSPHAVHQLIKPLIPLWRPYHWPDGPPCSLLSDVPRLPRLPGRPDLTQVTLVTLAPLEKRHQWAGMHPAYKRPRAAARAVWQFKYLILKVWEEAPPILWRLPTSRVCLLLQRRSIQLLVQE